MCVCVCVATITKKNTSIVLLSKYTWQIVDDIDKSPIIKWDIVNLTYLGSYNGKL